MDNEINSTAIVTAVPSKTSQQKKPIKCYKTLYALQEKAGAGFFYCPFQAFMTAYLHIKRVFFGNNLVSKLKSEEIIKMEKQLEWSKLCKNLLEFSPNSKTFCLISYCL